MEWSASAVCAESTPFAWTQTPAGQPPAPAPAVTSETGTVIVTIVVEGLRIPAVNVELRNVEATSWSRRRPATRSAR